MSAKVEDVEVRLVDGDPELRCSLCGTYLCAVDDGDSLAILVGMAEDHVDECSGANPGEGRTDG